MALHHHTPAQRKTIKSNRKKKVVKAKKSGKLSAPNKR